MAYATSNPPKLISQGIGGTWKLWVYKDADATTAVDASGYFTNGYELGMRAGDIIISVDTDASPISATIHIVTSAVAGTVDLSDGVAITATDSD